MSKQYKFAVCLSHDVDRIYKTHQYIYEGVTQLRPSQLAGLVSTTNPYWTFPQLMELEANLGVRSSIHILDEIPLSERRTSEWFSKRGWQLFGGRYDIEDEQVASILRVLDRFGWEIALHGSYTSSENPDRFLHEKERIEGIIDSEIIGNRQHYWRLKRPDTWRHLRDAGIKYDASLGSSTEIDFQHGYELIRPFDDEFVVFPWTLMDGALMQSGETFEECLEAGIDIVEETSDNNAVLVLDWHGGAPFNEDERPGWSRIYAHLIREALDRGAWVGSPREFYEAIPQPGGTISDALKVLASNQ